MSSSYSTVFWFSLLEGGAAFLKNQTKPITAEKYLFEFYQKLRYRLKSRATKKILKNKQFALYISFSPTTWM